MGFFFAGDLEGVASRHFYLGFFATIYRKVTSPPSSLTASVRALTTRRPASFHRVVLRGLPGSSRDLHDEATVVAVGKLEEERRSLL